MKKQSHSPKRKISQELRLLTLCAGYITPEQKKQIIKLMQRQISWDIFYEMAVKNGLYPIVYRNLKKLYPCGMDEQILARLEENYKINQLGSLLLTNELIRVTELLRQHDIKAINIKGPVLAMTVYQDISMRVSRDIDILVHPGDLAGVERILTEAGYTKDGAVKLTPRQEKLYRKMYHHDSYHHRNGIQLEVHWRLSGDYYNIAFEELWENRREIKLFGKQFQILREEENLIYLVYHGSRHAFKRLKWLCDLYYLMKNNSLDWDYIIKRADQLGMIHMLQQVLLLLAVLFGFRLQRQIPLTRKERRAAKRLALRALPFINSRYDGEEAFEPALKSCYKRYLLLWHIGLKEKVHYIRKHFMPTIEVFQTITVKDKYFVLYYIYRFIGILRRCRDFFTAGTFR